MSYEAKYDGEIAYVFVLRADGPPNDLRWLIARVADYTCHDLINSRNPINEIRGRLTASSQTDKWLYIIPPTTEELEANNCSSDCIKAYAQIREALNGDGYRAISMTKARHLDGSAWSPL